MGEQGGYIYPNLVGEYSASDPTDADGIDLEPAKVPYWHYNVEPNNANKISFSSLQPKLYASEDPEMSIEAQLGRYVDEKLTACLNEYEPFIPQGFQVQILSGPDTEVRVGESTVNFLLNLDVDAARGEAQQKMEQFYVKIPLRLKHYYEVADTIATTQKEHYFLEKQGLELVSVYSRPDAQKLPPVSDITFEPVSVVSWNEDAVKNNFKNLLVSYVPLLRYLGSRNFYYQLDPEGSLLAQKVFDNMVLPLSGAEDLGVNFDYFGWDMHFKVNSNGDTIDPEETFVKFSLIGLTFSQQRYETHYDVSYPVLVTLEDPDAFDGEGYSFVFALESNIRNNDLPTETDTVIEPYPRPITSFSCTDDYKNTDILRSVVVDSFTKEPVELVRVGFTIPELGECTMGLTDSQGALESKYPAVYGGVINFIRDDYLTGFYPIDTYKHQDQPAVLGYAIAPLPQKAIEMNKIVTKKVIVKKKSFQKCIVPLEPTYTISASLPLSVVTLGALPFKDISSEQGNRQCFFGPQGLPMLSTASPDIEFQVNNSLTHHNEYYFFDGSQNLLPEEETVLTLKRVKGFHDEVVEDDFVTAISIQGDEEQEVELVPGIYEVTGIVKLEHQVKILSEKRCTSYSILGWDTEECFDMEESTMESYVSGMLKWDTPATYLQITPEDLYTAKGVTFFVPVQNILSIPEKISVPAHRCGAITCLPGAGCVGETCAEENINIAGRIMEDQQVAGKIQEAASEPRIRWALEPQFT